MKIGSMFIKYDKNLFKPKVEHFSGLKLIKIERSPSPIIILPSLSSVQNANNQTGNRLKVSRQGVQSWQLNNSHVNRRSVQQQKMITALKSAGARRGQFALFASTIGSHRNKNVKSTGKSSVISPMTSRSSASANSNANSTQNGNETPTRYECRFFSLFLQFYSFLLRF